MSRRVGRVTKFIKALAVGWSGVEWTGPSREWDKATLRGSYIENQFGRGFNRLLLFHQQIPNHGLLCCCYAVSYIATLLSSSREVFVQHWPNGFV